MKQKAKGWYFFMDEQGKRIKEYVEAHGQEIIGDLVELTKAQSPHHLQGAGRCLRPEDPGAGERAGGHRWHDLPPGKAGATI